MAVDATTGTSFKTGIPRRLFDAPFRAFSGNVFVWDVTADGKEFLINAAAQESYPQPITVVLNWQAGLKN
jgi:hypothetical protein